MEQLHLRQSVMMMKNLLELFCYVPHCMGLL